MSADRRNQDRRLCSPEKTLTYVWDVDLDRMTWDGDVRSDLEISGDSLPKNSGEFRHFMNAQDFPLRLSVVNAALAGDETGDMKFDLIYRLRGKDGAVVHIRERAEINTDAKGKTIITGELSFQEPGARE